MKSINGERSPSDEPDEPEIISFLEKYAGSPNTLYRHKAAIKAYWEYICPGVAWPVDRRRFRAPRRRIPRYTSPANVPRLIEKAETEDEAMFLETLFQLGCRISELMGIEEKDILPTGVLVIIKGGDQRLKITTKEFNDKLKKYAQKHRKGRVFPKKYSYYYKLLKSIGHEAGIDDISPHMLRHARAVDLLNKGMPLAYVQQMLGHANINTTAIYLMITDKELERELTKAESGIVLP